MKRHSDRSIRAYRDSQRKLAIAKRRYADALRRYRDAEGEAMISKFKALKDKVDEKFAMFAKDHPDSIKYLKKFGIISSGIMSIFAGAAAAGLAGLSIDRLKLLKKHGIELKEIGASVPRVIGMFISAMAAVVLGYVGWAQKAKEKEAKAV